MKITKDEMLKQYPFKNEDILEIARKCIEGRDASVEGIDISSNTHVYDTFANLQNILFIKLNDTGQDDVTPSGTYHAQRGITLQFHLRGYWNEDDKKEFTINASKNTPGGMSIYGSYPTSTLKNIEDYIVAIIGANKPNNIHNMVY